jgi:hypothetical protein
LDNNQQDILTDLVITLNKKASKFDSSKIALSDTNFHAVKGYTVKSADTTFTKFTVHYNWKESEAFKLIVQKDAFTDSVGNTLAKNDTISFSVKRESLYGSLRLHFNNLDLSKNPVLEFMQEDKIAQSVPLTGVDWYQKLFQPGDYELRILYDDNKNGVWDPGNYDKKRQPEIVRKLPRKLTVKANWDNEVDINL